MKENIREIGDRPRFFREEEPISIDSDSPNKRMQPRCYARGCYRSLAGTVAVLGFLRSDFMMVILSL